MEMCENCKKDVIDGKCCCYILVCKYSVIADKTFTEDHFEIKNNKS